MSATANLIRFAVLLAIVGLLFAAVMRQADRAGAGIALSIEGGQ